MARFTIRYFAAAEDAAGRESEPFELPDPARVADLREALQERYGAPMARVLRSGSLLVDGVIHRDGSASITGDTVDVLPAFAGG